METENRQAYESVFTAAPLSRQQQKQKWLQLFKQKSPKLNVERHQLISLKRFAQEQWALLEDEPDLAYQFNKMNQWHGYIMAINEILAMDAE